MFSFLNKGISTPVGIFIIIVVTLILAIPIFYNYSWKLKQEWRLPSTSLPPKTNETADWLTYRDEILGIEVKYPNNWYANTLSLPDKPTSNVYIIDEPLTEQELGGLTHGLPGAFQIFAIREDDEWSSGIFEEYIKKEKPFTNFQGVEYTKIEKIKVDDRDVYKSIQFGEGDMASVGGYVTTIWFLNKGLIINFVYPNEYNQSYDHTICEKIFSTLNFIEEKK